MKKKKRFTYAIPLVLLLCGIGASAYRNGEAVHNNTAADTVIPLAARSRKLVSANEFSYVQQQFPQPDHQYGSAPLWVWNTKVDHNIIDAMLQDFEDKGFGGVFVHPRPGLITAYLSDDWLENWRYAMQKAKQLDMDIWIYDENSYPSGFAGGHVPAEMPSSWNQGQMLHMTKVQQLPDTANKFFLQKDFNNSHYLFSKENYETSDWYGGYSYVDLMVKGVTEKFIELTMRGYEKSVGNEFGKTVKGIFSDEPNIEVQGGGNIRWTPDLFKAFKEKHGYALEDNLPCLYDEVGNWQDVRHDYYETLLQLFIDRWSKPFYHYTEQKGLEWTGHYWEHAWPNPNHGGDNMAMYAWHQRPGIDLLFNQFDENSPNAQFGNIRAVKELASVANQLGKKRTLCETYGGGGWELSFMDMKRLGDWEFVLGVNTLNQHLADMTIAGARKYDYPQSFSYHNPWWPHYGTLNRYFARLSMALSRGQQQNDILILEPTTSAWMYYSPTHSNPRFQEIGEQFQRFVTQLEKAQVEYDLGTENIIKDQGKVADKKFVVGQRAYSTVVIPPGMDNIDEASFALLKQYTAAGGKVLLFSKPAKVNGAASNDLTAWLQQPQLVFLPQLDQQVIDKYYANEACSFPQLDTTQGNLYHHRRVLEDGQLLFLSNASMETAAHGQVQLKGKYALLMDLTTGKTWDYPATAAGNNISLQYELPPAGSLLFFVSDKEVRTGEVYTPPAIGQPVTASATAIQRLQPNVLTIDFCDVQLGDSVYRDQHVYNAADRVFKYFGFRNGNPWNTSVQYKRNIVDRDTFNRATIATARYHFTMDKVVATKGLQAVVERPQIWKVKLNGQSLKPITGKWWLDKSFAVYDISQAAKPGENILEITAAPMNILAEVEPVYILGNFSLQAQAQGFSLQPASAPRLGSWKGQGMQLYGQEMAYRKTFQADKGQYQVQLHDWKGTVAAVKVNGREAGIIDIPPYTLDISPYVHAGNNTVEVIVTGSLKNTLGPHHNKPRPGLVSPWHWRNVKEHPAGDAYDVYDYGLLTDFSINRSTHSQTNH